MTIYHDGKVQFCTVKVLQFKISQQKPQISLRIAEREADEKCDFVVHNFSFDNFHAAHYKISMTSLRHDSERKLKALSG